MLYILIWHRLYVECPSWDNLPIYPGWGPTLWEHRLITPLVAEAVEAMWGSISCPRTPGHVTGLWSIQQRSSWRAANPSTTHPSNISVVYVGKEKFCLTLKEAPLWHVDRQPNRGGPLQEKLDEWKIKALTEFKINTWTVFGVVLKFIAKAKKLNYLHNTCQPGGGLTLTYIENNYITSSDSYALLTLHMP